MRQFYYQPRGKAIISLVVPVCISIHFVVFFCVFLLEPVEYVGVPGYVNRALKGLDFSECRFRGICSLCAAVGLFHVMNESIQVHFS